MRTVGIMDMTVSHNSIPLKYFMTVGFFSDRNCFFHIPIRQNRVFPNKILYNFCKIYDKNL